ncbi:MAG: hypothetical protein DRG82_17450 [Deltaproteobacteria bacterium]|nr:MAG: hypothetical protein DRG82_17450 [Deltaproteobacteria bacterium]
MFGRFLIVFCLAFLGASSSSSAQKVTTPEGVRILQNKSFDDSERARREILEAFKDLRVTDVCDGMDLIGLQDVGLMDNSIRPLWRDVENFTHRFVGFAITVRHVPSDVRQGQNSFGDLTGFLKFKDGQYSRTPDAWLRVARPGDCAVIVVPREHALVVAKYAREIHEGDERHRARRYERLGRPLDETVIDK